MDNGNRKKIDERLKQVRKALGLKQKDIDRELEIGRTQMTNIEKEKTIPVYLLQWLHCKHNVSSDWILSGTGDMFVIKSKDHEDVKTMLKDFQKHPEYMHRMLSEYFIIRPFYIDPYGKRRGQK